MNYHEHLTTDYWKAASAKVKKRDGYRCRMCNSALDLCAHHRTYEHLGRELEHLGDLTCVCRRCHEMFHGKVVALPPSAIPQPVPRGMARAANQEHGIPKKMPKGRVVVREWNDNEINALMPQPTGSFPLTKLLVDRCRINGAFTTATLVALKVTDQTTGWPARLIGKILTAEEYRAALIGRNIYSRKGARNLAEAQRP